MKSKLIFSILFGMIFLFGMISYVESGTVSVTLNSPTDESISYIKNTLFNISASTNASGLSNVSLWSNRSGTWQQENLTEIGYEIGDYQRVYNTEETVQSNCGATEGSFCGYYTYNPVGSFNAYNFKQSIKSACTAPASVISTGISIRYSNGTTLTIPNTASWDGGNNWTQGCSYINTTVNNPHPLEPIDYIVFNHGRNYGYSPYGYSNEAGYTSYDSLASVTETYNLTISEGTTLWNSQACDVDGDCEFSSSNFTVTLDPNAPSITVNYPTSTINFSSSGNSIQFNFTATDTNLDDCWIEYDSINYTVSCSSGTPALYNITLTDVKTAKVWANDTIGNVNFSSASWDYKVFQNDFTYNLVSYETAREVYRINVTANSSLTAVTLIYNGTEYTPSSSSGNYTYTMDIPTSAVGNNSIIWKFIYGSETIYSDYYYQLIQPTIFTICNATYSTVFLNITFLDEETNDALNATIDNAEFVYYLGSGTITKTYLYSNTTENGEYNFCLSPQNRTMYNTRTIQYSSTGYPQRKNDDTTALTNSTTNKTLYLLSSADGIYSSIQVVDQNGDRVSGVEVTVERQFSGVWTIIGQETTDDAGSVTFWVNPDYDHRFTFESDLCSYDQLTIRPTQTQYTQSLSCQTGDEILVTNIEGIKYARTPIEGIIQTGLTNFTYQIVSSKDNIVNASFEIINSSSLVVLNSTSSTCTPSGCTLSFLWNVTSGADIKGRYYVDIGNGSILIEADAHWVNVYIPTQGKAGIRTFLNDLRYIFDGWGTDGNTQDFNRLIVIFFILCLAISVLNYHLGSDTVNPGAFLIFLFIFILFGSMAGGLNGRGLFYYNNLFGPTSFLNNYILVFITGILVVAYFLNVNRLAQR